MSPVISKLGGMTPESIIGCTRFRGAVYFLVKFAAMNSDGKHIAELTRADDFRVTHPRVVTKYLIRKMGL
ncbi:hypothetical protein DdX_02916 [Ditylenchus destructor]|uniref:Uncharacterized protein n=1 Tax=Ditylenchus destructor TaxID=166010 RepID=A0AAD4RCB6_9BILA|nr:hypothetical protein DdX_02916 [Ditylenchus destructor]